MRAIDTIETDDLGEARAFVTGTLAGQDAACRISACGDRTLDARLARCRAGRLHLLRASYGAAARVQARCPADGYLLEVLLAGRARCGGRGPERHDLSAGALVVRSPDTVIRTEMAAGSQVLVLAVPADLAEDVLLLRLRLRGHAGAPRSGAPRIMHDALDPAAGRLLAWLFHESRHGSALLSAPGVADDIEHLVVGSLGLCGAGRAEPGPPAYLERALHITDRDRHIRSTRALAAEVGVSVRTLQTAFRRWVGVPPREWMERRRLAAARSLLAGAEPTTTTVTRVAHDCGFSHLGRFAATYRELYGESPRVTLARHASSPTSPAGSGTGNGKSEVSTR